ncbi:MAG: hypothetical protein AAB669_01280, partial [Patescibacteria group bacterium]
MNKADFKKLLADLGAELTNSIGDLKTELVKAKSLHTRIKTYVDNSQKLVDKISNGETGLEAILTSAQTLESQISTLKTDSDTHLQSITNSLSSIQSHITEMETAYSTFTEINNKITNGETGLEAILTSAQTLESQ